mmetsp:Transcript_11806/g.26229  ORF Transcript_11806/g.26229 Transcript_11806/m.26229 type:complete len:218 (-) Transcript_11806:506-1159(-)
MATAPVMTGLTACTHAMNWLLVITSTTGSLLALAPFCSTSTCWNRRRGLLRQSSHTSLVSSTSTVSEHSTPSSDAKVASCSTLCTPQCSLNRKRAWSSQQPRTVCHGSIMPSIKRSTSTYLNPLSVACMDLTFTEWSSPPSGSHFWNTSVTTCTAVMRTTSGFNTTLGLERDFFPSLLLKRSGVSSPLRMRHCSTERTKSVSRRSRGGSASGSARPT